MFGFLKKTDTTQGKKERYAINLRDEAERLIMAGKIQQGIQMFNRANKESQRIGAGLTFRQDDLNDMLNRKKKNIN